MQASHIVFGWDEGDIDLSRKSLRTQGRYAQSQGPTKFDLWIILEEAVDFVRVEMIPTLDCLCCTGFSSNDRLALWRDLEERLFVAMVGLIL